MSDKKAVGWITLGVGAVAAVLVARELAGTRQKREKLAGRFHDGVGRARHAGEELLHEGEDYVRSLQNEANSLRSSVASGVSPRGEVAPTRGNGSNHESAVVAFMATVLVKGVSSYMQWRSMDKSRSGSVSNQRSSGQDKTDDRDPADMTVVELRREASSQNIDGRSGMNKQELVSALEE